MVSNENDKGESMNLSIVHLKNLERPWLLKRVDGKYSQHAHFYTRKHAERVRRLIDSNRYPISKSYRIAMERLLTKKEFKGLQKKDRYININKGIKR